MTSNQLKFFSDLQGFTSCILFHKVKVRKAPFDIFDVLNMSATFFRPVLAQLQLQCSSQILKHLSDFPLSNVDLGLQSFQCSKIRSTQHWGRRGAHLSENKGVKSECKKFGENSRQTAPVSTTCDEYCRSNDTHFAFSFSANVDGKEFAFEVH